MKKTYINPTTNVTTLELNSQLMAISMNSKEINAENAGLVKGENSNVSSSNDVWDKVWNREGLSN